MTTLSVIRSNLKRLILDEYPSVEKFAHEHDLDKSTLSRILGGKREPKISTLLKIAEALNIGVDAICGQTPHVVARSGNGPGSGDVVLKLGRLELVATGEDGRRLRTLAVEPVDRRVEIRVGESFV